MSFVLAQQQGWLTQNGKLPYDPVVSGDFAALRAAVADGTADFFSKTPIPRNCYT